MRKLGPAVFGVALIATTVGFPLNERPGKPRATIRRAQLIRPLEASAHECNHFGTFSCPASGTAAELSTADCQLDDGSYIDLFQFSGTAGQTVSVTMSSQGFDTYLFLLDPTPVVAAQNDDIAPGNTDSRITFQLTASGTWTVGATSLEPNQLGGYTLALQCSSAPPPTPSPTPTPSVTPVPTPTPIPGPCVAGPTTLCLNGGRFRVQMDWATSDGRAGAGSAVGGTSDTGMFWFFSPNNIEAIVKVVNGCAFNQRYWIFAGGLTNVATSLRVTDTQNGVIRTYTNPPSAPFQPVQDTAAFGTCP